ncbi:uncharacterized protein LOC113228137 [Hyposmocoma kahamanoa]|uniref:uncharacterized protein LOC113228137 n=1 Tax=Hyposmocoma kahamanoa TaxID=1477025 RepID=UPI000E6D9484|nr:uncharacterized protein LOC113228137 [Hyposmocoma kahamanoa]
MSQLIDDDMLLYGSKPHHSHAAQDTLTEKTNEVLEELKCNLCDNIIKAPKDEIEDGPKPKHEEGDPLLANFNPAGTTSQLLTVHECLDTGATESEEGEPPQKRPAFSPFEPLQTPTTFTLETTQASSAKENQILLQIKPHKSRNKRKLYIPVPNRPKQMHVQTHVQTSTRPIILRRTPKDKSLPLNRSTQQGHSSETLVSTQILAEKRICNLIVKNSKTSIRPSNIIVQNNRTPIIPSHVIVQDNRTPITPSHVIIQDNRRPITPGNNRPRR